MSKYLKRHPSHICSTTRGGNPTLATTIARGEIARRALTVRVLGYIITPVLCIFPITIIDLLGRTKFRHGIDPPPAVGLLGVITASLQGTLNTILLCFDPSIVAVVFWPHWKKRKERERMQRRAREARPQPNPPPPAPASQPSVLGDPEMGESKTTDGGSQDIVMSTIHYDHGLEIYGHFEVYEISDIDITFTSTIGYDTEELAEIFRGL